MKRIIRILVCTLLLASLLASCEMAVNLQESNGRVTGIVQDSTNTTGVEGVLVSVSGLDITTTTDATGYFTISLPSGTHILHFTKIGFTFTEVSVTIASGNTVDIGSDGEDVVAYTPLSAGQIRIVLTWGENPADLDSHLYIPGIDQEIYYADKVATDDSANLDWDDTTSYGPETITITTQLSGTYYYSIYHFSGYGNLGTSSAVVKVYDDTGLIRTFTAATATGDGTKIWWRVFSLDGSVMTAQNSFSDTGW
ncbi:hypothetical protein SpiGrapes_0227 [Sphaerochaeta pleomorpha str. Grapes]|uniref:Carboxypeptidase regulatory-like domain-containing protein n=1 Tax=Sphaerochaeta pleomorpha (strain ATCC BAA-1885 / DSM 22778 / Grapes) TaxID=158190 RepID=G8QUC0_SPHPG|nr:carboxypeptidase-like regulatory domain-containing protein [Sphaerochaeta pleomorpha]AEV28090.1 hypothetical protein SpiGrapes_0227 [Sphaerochaeta pleomorpha str. Grapes]